MVTYGCHYLLLAGNNVLIILLYVSAFINANHMWVNLSVFFNSMIVANATIVSSIFGLYH